MSNESERIAALEGAVAELHGRLLALEGAAQGGTGQQQPYPQHGGRPSASQSGLHGYPDWNQPPWPEIIDLVRRGKKIMAIKRHREVFGTGLKDSKDVIDRIA